MFQPSKPWNSISAPQSAAATELIRSSAVPAEFLCKCSSADGFDVPIPTDPLRTPAFRVDLSNIIPEVKVSSSDQRAP